MLVTHRKPNKNKPKLTNILLVLGVGLPIPAYVTARIWFKDTDLKVNREYH